MLFALLVLSCNSDTPKTKDTTKIEDTAQLNTNETDTENRTNEDTSVFEEEEQESPYNYEIPNRDLCDHALDMTHGFLCAIRPSRLDPMARDQFGTDSLLDRTLGFGYHVVAFPLMGQEIKGVYVHFTGSMGRAFNQNNEAFPSSTLLDEAMKAGFITIQIAYHNRHAVNSPEECLESTDVDNCAGGVRLEKITGEDISEVVDGPLSDSINQRIKTVVQYFEQQDFIFPISIVDDNAINWSELVVGGHSQGSGHALYIEKYWNSAHTCLFGGPYDVADTVPEVPVENIADWYLDEDFLVDITKVRGLISIDDNNYEQFVQSYNILSMQQGIHWQSIEAPVYSDINGDSISGHGAVVHDPAFVQQRYDTCFSHTQ